MQLVVYIQFSRLILFVIQIRNTVFSTSCFVSLNMALRATDHEDSSSKDGQSAISGLALYWQEADKKPKCEWRKWWDLFAVAMTAKFSISVQEVLRELTDEVHRNKELLNGLTHPVAERKCVSVMFLSLGAAARKTLADKYPTMKVAETSFKDFVKNCEDTFNTKRNRTLDRFRFLSRKQKQTESLEQFWHALNGMAADCDFGAQTESLVHDIFILNMKNLTVQERLCTEPKTNPKDALEFAIAFEEGSLRQKSYGESKIAIKQEPVCNINPKKNCTRCGMENFTPEHLAVCKAKGKKCNNCGVLGHFGRVCKRPQVKRTQPNKGPRRINWVEEESESNEEGSEDSTDKLVLSIEGAGEAPFTMKGKINNKKFSLMIDSGSPVTIIGHEELRKILNYDVLFVRPLPKHEKYVDFNKQPLDIMGYIYCELEVGTRRIKKARILVARKGVKSIVGRDWLKHMEYKIVQKKPGESDNSVNSVEQPVKEMSETAKLLKTEFANLFERQGKIKHHKIHARLHENAEPKQQKGRRVPIQLQEAVESEINKLLREGHIVKVDEIKEDVFIQPTVITVKKDRSVKIALDARELNKNVIKDKYPMPNLDNLMDMIAEQAGGGEGTTYFTTLDMKYAYGQVELSPETSRHCNFQILGGAATGVYRFVTGFYGLTIMPTEFQRIIDLTLAGITNTFAFIDDILVVTRGSKQEHLVKVKEVLHRLDEANVGLKLEKCNFAAESIEWVGYKLTQSGVEPINSKVQGISERLRPKNLKQLRSFLGAVNQLNKFIPDLAKICFPFRSLLKKDNEWNWTQEHEEAFKRVNCEIKKITKINHFKRDRPLRIICDASKAGLGAVLQQKEKDDWKPISFASRFLTDLESKYSVNELELLAIVWAVEYFRSYVYGVHFKIISDHKALATVLKGNKGNKTYSSRLTRWVDRLLPYDFEVIHGPGRTLGIADYLSRNPTEHNENAIDAKTLWDEWFTVNIVSELKQSTLANENAESGDAQPIGSENEITRNYKRSKTNDSGHVWFQRMCCRREWLRDPSNVTNDWQKCNYGGGESEDVSTIELPAVSAAQPCAVVGAAEATSQGWCGGIAATNLENSRIQRTAQAVRQPS